MPQDLDWLLGPLAPAASLQRYFEKTPPHVAHRPLDYYRGVFTPADLAVVIHQSPELVRRNLKTSRMLAGAADAGAPDAGSPAALSLSRRSKRVLVQRLLREGLLEPACD